MLLSTSDAALQLFNVSPALFAPNLGQWADESVRFVHDGSGANVAMTDSGPVFQLFQSADAEPTPDDPLSTVHRPLSTDPLRAIQFSASFVGANTVAPVGMEQAETVFNYHVGDDPSRWLDGVPSYEVVAYEGLYDGVDLRTWGLRSHLKYEFHVAPGGDYSQIQVHYDGIAGLSLAEDGSLVVDLGGEWGSVVDDAPYIYQEINGEKIEVAGRFVLLDAQTYAFEVTGHYDPAQTLVIDPELVWSSYLGGTNGDMAYDVGVDIWGGVYVTGWTYSSGWVSGGYDTSFGGSLDAFVVMLNTDGSHAWSTYLGGSGDDNGAGIAVDCSGSYPSVYVTGQTKSPGWVSGGYDTSLGGSSDAFVVKLDYWGHHIWSTYLGGDSVDSGAGIAADSYTNQTYKGVYVVGYTESAGWMAGEGDTTYNGNGDAFVAKICDWGDSESPWWSTYVGGSDADYGDGIAVDSAYCAYVTGETNSSGWVSGGYDPSYNGGCDAFVIKLADGGAASWSTYLGGSDADQGYGIAVDGSYCAYVTGQTASSGWVSSGGYDPSYNGGGDAFVIKLADGGAASWSTYLGGSSGDAGKGIAVDASGVYVSGETLSSGWVSGGFDTTFNGNDDGFVAKLTPTGIRIWSTYLGGSSNDFGAGIAVDGAGGVYVSGSTGSSGWVSGGWDASYNGNSDGFVAEIEDGGYQIIELGAGLPEPLTKVTFVNANNDLVSVSVGKTGYYRLTREIQLFDTPSNNAPGDLLLIEAWGTDAKSSIKIAAKAVVKGQVPTTSVGDIVIDGSLGSLSAPLLNVRGNVTITGGVGKLALGDVAGQHVITIGTDPLMKPASLVFGRMRDVSLTSAMPLTSLSVVEWLETDGTPDLITAPWISSLATRGSKVVGGPVGDFETQVSLSGVGATKGVLSKASIAGSVVGGAWQIVGAVGSVAVRGNFTNCTFLAVSLKSLGVTGLITQDASDADTDFIHILTGGFSVSDLTWKGYVPPDHWFTTLRAYVG